MRTTRRLLLVTLLLALFVCLLTITAGAATPEDDFTYTVSLDGEAAIDCYLGTASVVEVPATIDGYPVTSVGGFEEKDVTEVVLPEGIKRISIAAFYGCTNLQNITIPSSVKSIEEEVFNNCTSLKSVTFGSGKRYIGYKAFYNCTALEGVYITDLAGWCETSFCDEKSNPLNYAGNLYVNGVLATDITINEGTSRISARAFYGCTSITSVTVPSGLVTIEYCAFKNCTNLKKVTLLDEKTDIDKTAIPDYVELIDNSPSSKITDISFGEDSSFTYDGTIKTPTIVVYDSEGKYISPEYYTLTYPCDMIDAGEYIISIEFMGEYKGITKTITYKINPIDGSDCEVRFKKPTTTYSGNVKTPAVVVTGPNGEKLSEKDYTVNYPRGMRDAGTYKVNVTLKGNYSGKKSLTYKIEPIDISRCQVSIKKTRAGYNGKGHLPYITVTTPKGNELSDFYYNVSHGDITNAGTYKVTVTLKHNYTGTTTFNYTVDPIDVSRCTVKFPKPTTTYNGKVKRPTVEVYSPHGSLVPESNYTVTYPKGMKNVGTYDVKVTMKGNYSGTKTLTYRIDPIDISRCTVKFKKATTTYNGKVKTPAVVVYSPSGTVLSESRYTVTYPSNMKNAGTYNVKVTMKGNYKGSTTIKYTINPIDISKCAVAFRKATTTYNGTVKRPAVDVYNPKGNILSASRYTITYPENMKDVGTYKIKVTLKGNYGGSTTLTYKILPTEVTTATICVGNTYKIGAKSNTSITYTTSDSNIATVTEKGTIKGKSAGTAYVTVKSNGISQKIKVTVIAPAVTITNKESSTFVGRNIVLDAETFPRGLPVTWYVSDENVAEIFNEYSVRLVGRIEGTVTVTAEVSYGGKTYRDTLEVKVTIDYPDIDVYMTKREGSHNDYYVTITNNKTNVVDFLNVYGRGSITSGGETVELRGIVGENRVWGSANLWPEDNHEFRLALSDVIKYSNNDTVYLNFYIEFRGEFFLVKCRSDRAPGDCCYSITHSEDPR